MAQPSRFSQAILSVILVLACAAHAADLDTAWSELQNLHFTGAVDIFRTLRDTSETGSDAWAEATMGLALSLHQRQPDTQADKDAARALYTELTDALPDAAVSAVALLMLGRLDDLIDYFEDTADPASARTRYARVIRDFPSLPLVHIAALYRAESQIQSMDPEQVRAALAELHAWLDAHPDNPMASHQWMLIGYTQMYPLDDPAAAAEALVRAEEAGLPPNTKLDVFYWRVANLAQQGGKRNVAVRYYSRIVEEVRRTGFAYEARERIRELGADPPDLIDPFAPGDRP
jgi:tetratricopeptide (TPR) repeat protein